MAGFQNHRLKVHQEVKSIFASKNFFWHMAKVSTQSFFTKSKILLVVLGKSRHKDGLHVGWSSYKHYDLPVTNLKHLGTTDFF